MTLRSMAQLRGLSAEARESRLAQPWAIKSLSADIHLNVLNSSYDRLYL